MCVVGGTAATPKVLVTPPPPPTRVTPGLLEPKVRLGEAQHRENSLRPGGHSRPLLPEPPRGIPPLPHLRPRLGPPQAGAGGRSTAGAGRGQGGSRRRNHKAASLAGRGHSHKTYPLAAAEKGYLPCAQSAVASESPVFLLKE